MEFVVLETWKTKNHRHNHTTQQQNQQASEQSQPLQAPTPPPLTPPLSSEPSKQHTRRDLQPTPEITILHRLLHFNFMDTQPSKAPEVVTIDVHAAKLLITSGHRYLDVRTEEEFKKGHVDVENALNIPYMFNNPEGRVKNPKFMEQVLSLCKPDDHLVVGCQSGVRSVYATTDLLKADFKNVCNMGGGYLAWVENGFAVTKPSEEKKVVENGSAVTDPSEEEKVVENGFSVTKPSEEEKMVL